MKKGFILFCSAIVACGVVSLSSVALAGGEDEDGCTGWIITGGATVDGRPIIVKNRDCNSSTTSRSWKGWVRHWFPADENLSGDYAIPDENTNYYGKGWMNEHIGVEDTAYRYQATSRNGFWPWMGVNTKGLVVGEYFADDLSPNEGPSTATTDYGTNRCPPRHMLRYCTTVDSSHRWLSRVDTPAGSAKCNARPILFVADTLGKAAVLEHNACYPDDDLTNDPYGHFSRDNIDKWHYGQGTAWKDSGDGRPQWTSTWLTTANLTIYDPSKYNSGAVYEGYEVRANFCFAENFVEGSVVNGITQWADNNTNYRDRYDSARVAIRYALTDTTFTTKANYRKCILDSVGTGGFPSTGRWVTLARFVGRNVSNWTRPSNFDNNNLPSRTQTVQSAVMIGCLPTDRYNGKLAMMWVAVCDPLVTPYTPYFAYVDSFPRNMGLSLARPFYRSCDSLRARAYGINPNQNATARNPSPANVRVDSIFGPAGCDYGDPSATKPGMMRLCRRLEKRLFDRFDRKIADLRTGPWRRVTTSTHSSTNSDDLSYELTMFTKNENDSVYYAYRRMMWKRQAEDSLAKYDWAPDVTAPVVDSVRPANLAENQGTACSVRVWFSEDVCDVPANFVVKGSVSGYHADSLLYVFKNKRMIMLKPTALFSAGEAVYCTVYAVGAKAPLVHTGVSDLDGNRLGTTTSWVWFPTTPTAVEFSSFSAEAGDGEIRLVWRTESEINNQYWLIERTTNYTQETTQWNRIARVPGNGTKPTPIDYVHSDREVASGVTYFYHLGDVDIGGNITWHGPVSATARPKSIPTTFGLGQNYPNPSSGNEQIIEYQVPVKTFVSLKLYDITGRMIKVLVNEPKEAGYYTVKWDGKDEHNREVSSGIYFYRLSAENYVGLKKLLIVR